MTAAIVTSVLNPTSPGNRRWGLFDFTFSTVYPAGGEPMTPSLFGMQAVDCVIPMGSVLASAEVINVYDRTNNTLALYTASTGAKVATSSDQSANVVTILVIGE